MRLDLTKTLPSSPEAEEAVLTAILTRSERLQDVLDELTPRDFHSPVHRAVFEAMASLAKAGRGVDLVTVGDALEARGKLDEVGGPVYLAELASGLVGNVSEHVRIVKDRAARRALIESGLAVAEQAQDLGRDPVEIAKRLSGAGSAVQACKPRLVAVDIAQLLQTEFPPGEYVLNPVIPRQGLAMLYAPRGVGKTFTALSIAYAVASGQKVFRWRADRPRRTLYVDGEMPGRVMKERLAQIIAAYDGEAQSDYIRIVTPDLQPDFMPNLASEGGQAMLEPFLEGVEFVVVDNLATLARGGRENEAEGWLPVQQWILGLRRRGLSVLLVHHAGKGGQQRGTSSREDVLDTVIALKRPHDYRQEEGARFEVHLEKARGICGDDAKPFEATLEAQGSALVWRCRDMEDVRLAQVRALLAEGMTVREIAEETDIPKSTVQRLKKKLEAA